MQTPDEREEPLDAGGGYLGVVAFECGCMHEVGTQDWNSVGEGRRGVQTPVEGEEALGEGRDD